MVKPGEKLTEEALLPVENFYPRVKIRAQEKPVTLQEEHKLLIRDRDSLSFGDQSSSKTLKSNLGKERRIYSPPCVKISSLPSRSCITPVSPTKGKEVKDCNDESRIRASSVPRPRAVLSSPDNDEMIGNQNQQVRESGKLQTRPTPGHGAQHGSGKLLQSSKTVAGPPICRKPAAAAAGRTTKSTMKMEKQQAAASDATTATARRPRSPYGAGTKLEKAHLGP